MTQKIKVEVTNLQKEQVDTDDPGRVRRLVDPEVII